MKPQLIEKVIKSYNEPCPKLLYKNPLLDPNVTKALSKSFVKALSSKHNINGKVNNNLTLSVLQNIRKICKLEPENHKTLNGNIKELLVDAYRKNTLESRKIKTLCDAELNAFLMRTFNNLIIKSNENITVNPEIIQALVNLDNEVSVTLISDNVIHWNTDDSKFLTLLNNLLNQDNCKADDIVIKMKPDLEARILNCCLKCLQERTVDLDLEFNETCMNLFKISAVSASCFQICCNILNTVYISSNYDSQLLKLIGKFISIVKLNCKEFFLPCLYKTELKHIVLLLDINFNSLSKTISEKYIQLSLTYLKDVENKSPNDYVMLLTHFPHWFNQTQ